MKDIELGVVRCGKNHLAVPLEALAEVAQVTSLMPILQPTPGLQGALDLRGTLIPVFDPIALSDTSKNTRSASKFAIILRWENHSLGLGIDEIEGLIHASTKDLQHMDTSIEPLSSIGKSAVDDVRNNTSIARSALLNAGNLISVICVETLFKKLGRLSSQGIALEKKKSRTDGTETVSRESIPILIFTAGGTDYALRATAIQGTVPKSVVKENALSSGACLGSIEYHGQRTPVLKTEEVTGLGLPGVGRETEMVVLRLEGGARVALAVDSIERMVSTDLTLANPVPPALAKGTSVVSGALALMEDERQIFLLCPEKLQKHPLVSDMGKLSLPPSNEDREKTFAARCKADVIPERVRHLVFDVGTPLAAPAEQILRILRPPESLAQWNASDMMGVEGVFRVEDRPVLYVDLARRLGMAASREPRSRVLLVGHNEHRVGFAVGSVEGIDTSKWRRSSVVGQNTGTIVQLGSEKSRRILPALDLKKLAETICS